ncbi:DoxX family protein [Kitasatospora sp. NPDC058170]|uniref:DoxX family protein n=1 Tax=Kitasatospora sp. NPDC058170 TaxID=3346364 RepID=UPI0036DA3F48
MPARPIPAVDTARPVILTVFRVVVGLLFACHGVASLFGVLGGAKGGGSVPVGEWPGWWAALIQLVGGILVLVGLGTRTAALLCSGSMAYAYFSVHQEHALMPIQNGGEASAMFSFAFLAIAALGPGPFALERLLPRRAGTGLTGQPGSAERASQPAPTR